MKKLLLFLGVCALTIAIKAQVPTYQNQTLVSHIAVAASTASNLNVVADVRKQSTVAVSISGTNAKPDAVNKNTLFYTRSVDGTSYESTYSQVAWNGNTNVVPQCIVTNLNTYGAGYIKFLYVTNAADTGTNIGDFNLSYGVKISAP